MYPPEKMEEVIKKYHPFPMLLSIFLAVQTKPGYWINGKRTSVMRFLLPDLWKAFHKNGESYRRKQTGEMMGGK